MDRLHYQDSRRNSADFPFPNPFEIQQKSRGSDAQGQRMAVKDLEAGEDENEASHPLELYVFPIWTLGK